jgi:glutamyl-tRNA synthetase
MEITHVIRGEEWLPSLALHYQLYDAFGWETPEFAHLPLILKPTGKGKLSKRDGDKLGFPVFPLQWNSPDGEVSIGYKEEGYFPEAMVNFLAFLGWNPGTEQEIFSLDELISAFELERVHKSGARFDPDKIKWFNHHYMQEQTNEELAVNFKKIVDEHVKDVDVNYISLVIGIIKERATFLTDFWDLSFFFFEAPRSYDEKIFNKAIHTESRELMSELGLFINTIEDDSLEHLQTQIKNWITEKGIGFGKVMQPLRLALVGAMQGPDVFEIIFMIGKKETISRIKSMIETL